MKQAANLRDFRVGLLRPASRIDTSATDYQGITFMQLQRFNGASWDEVKRVAMSWRR
jgi:branched-chain amino acid transport system substrate-binding protein